MWSCVAALPNSLVDLLDTGEEEEEFDFDDYNDGDCE